MTMASTVAPELGGSSWGDLAEPCYYCGLPADTIDHVIPRALLAQIAILGDPAVTGYFARKHRVRVVPACRECNGLLGARYYGTLAERKEALKASLRRRYRRQLQTPLDWTDREIGELGYGLQITVITGVAFARNLRDRLAW